ncbi:hypothetical protein HNY73_017867 [Argiope bruennichi]|uniref:Uncharacterized protein n=1 Tax=Argiope bruennichi TaxID=94029 RepID=A0A8T0EB49_ARGBR|nr:hypothetical protein HNY73_017867 [Argiope bruennichi]
MGRKERGSSKKRVNNLRLSFWSSSRDRGVPQRNPDPGGPLGPRGGKQQQSGARATGLTPNICHPKIGPFKNGKAGHSPLGAEKKETPAPPYNENQSFFFDLPLEKIKNDTINIESMPRYGTDGPAVEITCAVTLEEEKYSCVEEYS